MKEVELIFCHDNNTWTDCNFAKVPDQLWEKRNTDDVVDWVIEESDLPTEGVVHIGIYNWNDSQEHESQLPTAQGCRLVPVPEPKQELWFFPKP